MRKTLSKKSTRKKINKSPAKKVKTRGIKGKTSKIMSKKVGTSVKGSTAKKKIVRTSAKKTILPKGKCCNLNLDFPKHNSEIGFGHYAFRISCDNNVEHAQVSINNGDWQCCSNACGHWWYQWHNYERGEFTAKVRVFVKGKPIHEDSYKFKVN